MIRYVTYVKCVFTSSSVASFGTERTNKVFLACKTVATTCHCAKKWYALDLVFDDLIEA